ncbi:MAG: ATP-dependent helicase [Muribaculaceae bacterium]
MSCADYLNDLNAQQRAAVEYISGPELVVAGAGSGKTRVLTYKIVHLLAKQYEPGRIMALTFTNKAAKEMRERIEALTGTTTARRLWMGTFHSIFSRILRRNAELIGYNANYTIYDQTDARNAVKMIIRDLELDEKVYKPATVQDDISRAKNYLLSPEDYALDRDIQQSDQHANRPQTGEIYRIYMNRCRVANAMDFDDLLYYTAVLFRDHPEVLSHYREFFRYILVDEYQDTNFAQNMIVMQLCRGIGNICVVGDDAQSIYSFRGANIRNILDLQRAFPTLETFKLEQNYRSTQNIVNAANSLIAHNRDQIRKNVFSENGVGDKIEVSQAYSDYDEAGVVAARIVSRRAVTGDAYSDFAVLYRTNAQSRVLEEALRRRNIPYRIYGGLAFYQRKEVKDALAYFHLGINPNDDECVRRVINTPARGIGKVTIDKLNHAAMEGETSMWEVLCDPDRFNVDLNSGTKAKLLKFRQLIESFIDKIAKENDVEAIATHIITVSGLAAMYMSDRTPENISKYENLMELIAGAHTYMQDRLESGEGEDCSMGDFLTNVALATDQDKENEANSNSVTLMTIHASKGLEFNNIFVVGVEDELIPSRMSSDTAAGVEEERRLFYVAITRAKNFCMLSYAQQRFLNGQTVCSRCSRFMQDIDTEYLTGDVAKRKKATRPAFEPAAAAPQPIQRSFGSPSRTASADASFRIYLKDELDVKMRIAHQKFGRGEIIDFIHTNLGDGIIVLFDNDADPRKLLLPYAKIRIINE